MQPTERTATSNPTGNPAERNSKEKANSNMPKNVRDDFQSLKQDGANIAHTVMEQGHDTYDHLKASSARYVRMLENEVASKPVQSMAIAVGAGMILSFLLRRG